MEHTVAKITPSGKVKDRFYIDFSDGSSLTVTINQIADHSIFTGRVFDDEEYELLEKDSAKENARGKALRLLGTRPMSRNFR